VLSARRHPAVWMSHPIPFEDDMVVRAIWLRDTEVAHREQTGPLKWGQRVPDYSLEPPYGSAGGEPGPDDGGDPTRVVFYGKPGRIIGGRDS
jgi:hypothetical protein